MADHLTGETAQAPDICGAMLSDEQRATFRSAGFWMAIIGWVEMLSGALVGLYWLLAAIGSLPGETVGTTPLERTLAIFQVAAALIIGILTLIAARSFRRAGREPGAGLPAVTAAVADLAELFERQVWVVFGLLVILIGGIAAKWWL